MNKVIAVGDYGITFDNGLTLSSFHSQDCCETHELYFKDLSLADFAGLEFDLSNDKFFNRIDGYGIELLPVHGFPVRVAGYGSNNGYYSSDLSLALNGKDVSTGNEVALVFDITSCQTIT